MATLQQTNSLPAYAYDLFEAIGYTDVGEIISTDVKQLQKEFSQANDKLNITSEPFNETQISDWLDHLRTDFKEPLTEEVFPKAKASHDEHQLVNFEDPNEIEQALITAQHAIRYPIQQRQEAALSQDSITEAAVISYINGSYQLRASSISTTKDTSNLRFPAKNFSPQTNKKPVDITSFKKPDEQDIKPLKRRTERSFAETSENLNKGIDPRSRKFAKGVLHPHPSRIRIGAIATLISIVIAVLCFSALAISIYFYKELGSKLSLWLGGIIFVMFITLIFYLRFGVKARCCVCSQRIYITKQCKRHLKAHHFPVIGFIIPTALQLLLYRWFYCMYCGTAVRLKK